MKRQGWTMRRAILLCCIGSVVAALLLQTALFQRILRQQIRAESMADNETSLEKMQADIAAYIHGLRTEMLTIYNETELIASLRKVADEGADSVSLKEYYWDAWYFARKRFSGEDRLLAMYWYDAQDSLVSTYRFNCIAFAKDIYRAQYDVNAERVKEFVQEGDGDMMISGYYNSEVGREIIRFVLRLHNYDEQRRQIGYIVCEVDSAVLTSIMEKYFDMDQACVWLQPVYDQAIATMGNISEEQSSIQNQISQIIENEYGSRKLQEEYSDYYLIRLGQEDYNLEACALVSMSLLTSAQQSLARALLVIMTAMLAAVAVFGMFLTNRLSRPVEEMRDSIVRIKNGETDLRVQPVGWSMELEMLGTEFNEMLNRLEAMAEEEYKYKLLVERTEYKMLQAQINPHFLYNSLDTMSGIANAQNCTLVSGMCRSLSAIFRYSLNMTDELSNVQKEMAHVRNYLYVMDVRNGFTVAYDYQIDSDTLGDRLPRICLQPIVENAVTHGLRNVRRKDKRLLIRAEHQGDDLVVVVRDNGVGMDAEDMNRKLERNDPRRVESGVSIGILNVNARLKKLFGEAYGLRIESRPDEGTAVILTVPAVRETADLSAQGQISLL